MGMDIPRSGQAQKSRLKRTVFIVAGLAVVLLVTVFLRRLEPAAPTVAAETLLIDQVKRGEMLRPGAGPPTPGAGGRALDLGTGRRSRGAHSGAARRDGERGHGAARDDGPDGGAERRRG